MKHPMRDLFELLGLVRRPDEDRYEEADRVARDGKAAAEAARRRRLAAIEHESYRRET